jgi:small subunit ribosomal protein S16
MKFNNYSQKNKHFTMATKIRLQRGGRKGYAVYRIVIADARAPRDGRFTEKIGMYNPNTNPATVDLNFDRALYWVEVGAQPTDTVRNILSREGVYLMKHLRGGVKKGAFDEATAQKKFDAWKADKQKGLEKIAADEAKAKKDAAAKALDAEKKVNEEIAKKVADKKAAIAAAKAEEEAAKAAEAAAAEAPAAEEAAPAEA